MEIVILGIFQREKKYEEDVESQTKQKSTDTIIFAVDLEKVIDYVTLHGRI